MLALVYLTHSELYGSKLSHQALKAKLRRLGRSSVLSNLAVVNNIYAHSAFIGKGQKDYPEIQALLKDAYFSDDVRSEIVRKRLENRFVFLRLQNLYLAQLSILHSTDARPIIVDGSTEGGYELGACSLIAADFLLSVSEHRKTSSGSELKIKRHLGFQLAPGGELSNPLDMFRGVVRSEIIFSDILNSAELQELAGEKLFNGFDVATQFESAVGITPAEYIDITVGLLSYFLFEDDAHPITSIRSIQIEPFLAQSHLHREKLQSYLTLESRTVDELKERFIQQSKYHKQFSFLPFKSHPIIEVQSGHFFCIDTFFLSEKLNAGLYWKIFDNLPKNQRESFSQIYGYAFEIYVRRSLRETLNTPKIDAKKGLLFSDPRYENGDQSFDEIIYYPDTKHLIVIETKASFMHTEAKFGRKISKFWKEIKQKFIEKETGEVKGIGQMANHIGHLFAPAKSSRRHVVSRELDHWIQTAEKVSPIIVVQEPVISFHIHEDLLNTELKKRLKKMKHRPSVSVANLTVLNIDTLEMLRPHLIDKELTLEQCVNYRNYRDPNYRSDFASLINENFDLKNRTDERTDAVFSSVFARATERLFDQSRF
jgi:hypothetical protein